MFGKHCWYTSASTQQAISTSSGEAEYYALVKAGSRAIGFKGLTEDLGFHIHGPVDLQIDTDSAAAKGIAVRRGVGKVRHLEVGTLWLQAAVAANKSTIKKIDGKVNPGDLCTKGVDGVTMQRHLQRLNIVLSQRRSTAMPKAQVNCVNYFIGDNDAPTADANDYEVAYIPAVPQGSGFKRQNVISTAIDLQTSVRCQRRCR